MTKVSMRLKRLVNMEDNIQTPRKIEYYHPLFHRRIFADVIDALLMSALAILFFVGLRYGASFWPESTRRSTRMDQEREASGLYLKVEGTYHLLSAYYPDHSETATPEETMGLYEKGMTTFLAYLEEEAGTSAKTTVSSDYDAFRLSIKDDSGVSYFVSVAGVVEKNPSSSAKYADYNSKVYVPYYNDHAEGYFTTLTPNFIEDSRYFSLWLLFYEIPVAVLLASILTFYVPPLFFKRGRQTLGKFLYKIGRVDSHCLSLSFGRYTAESAILIFAVVLLSLFTLGVPLIISFSLMAFSQKRQDFPDYMLGIEEVDISDTKIYKTPEEAEIEFAQKEESPVTFTPEERL